MTQYLATCTNCKGLVNHLERSAVVDRCDRCKGEGSDEHGRPWVAPHLVEEPPNGN